jgi:hypothetical protein
MSKLQKKPSALKRGHPTLQNMNFYQIFLLLWVIFALLDPDPDSESGYTGPMNPDPIQIRNPALKVHKNDNFFGFDFEFCTVSLLVMLKYESFVKNNF